VQSYRPAFAARGIDTLLAVPEAFVLANTGRSAEAIRLLGPEPEDSSMFVLSSLARCVALSGRGSYEAVLATSRRGHALIAALSDPRSSIDPLFYTTSEGVAWAGLGRFDEVYAALLPAHSGLVEERMIFLRCLIGLVIGQAALAQGDVATADRWFADVLSATAVQNLPGANRIATAGRAAVAGQRLDREQAAAWLDRLDALGPDTDYMLVETQIGRSWAQHCLGFERDAVGGLREVATWAIDADEPVAALQALAELTRLDDARWAADRLDAMSSAFEIEGPLAAARRAFVRASAEGAGASLWDAARQLSDAGAHLVAAEAASRVLRKRDITNSRVVAAMRALVTSSLRHCDGAQTPALSDRSIHADRLSKRETEVATLAASGLSNKELVERLFVSQRTIENHLQRVYIKLGISSREQLTRELAG
jgi:ATP/maltotriose-dependent transcriptional regulator MalT